MSGTVDKKLPEEIQRVQWVDSCMQHGEVERHELPTPSVIESVGFVVAETAEHITLSFEAHHDGCYRMLCSIPRVAIRQQWTLKPA